MKSIAFAKFKYIIYINRMDSIKQLTLENEILKQKILELEARLKKYTNSKSHQEYYERNKDIVKEKSNARLIRLKEENPDKLKEYRRTAYLNRKAKLQKEKDMVSNDCT